jgi:hypothetical protein
MPLRVSLALGPVGPSLTVPRRARLCSEEPLGGDRGAVSGGEVADHASVDDVGEVAFEDPAGFFLGVPAGARVSVDALSAQLRRVNLIERQRNRQRERSGYPRAHLTAAGPLPALRCRRFTRYRTPRVAVA